MVSISIPSPSTVLDAARHPGPGTGEAFSIVLMIVEMQGLL